MSLALVLISLVAVSACQGRKRFAADNTSADSKSSEPAAAEKGTADGKLVAFDLTGGAPESISGGLFGVSTSRSFTALVQALQRVRKDDDITGVYVRLGGARFGFARTEEIGRELGAIRAAGKPVVCYAHTLGNSSSWLMASGCDRVWLAPAGDVETVGIAGQVVYLKGVLDKLGVEADFLHMGRYKSFAEQFTREGPTDEARKSLVETLRSIREVWLSEVVKARGGGDRTRRALEDGPWGADEAKAEGLVDAVGYESDALAEAKQKANAEEASVVFGSGKGGKSGFNLAGLIRSLSGAESRKGGPDKVVVLPAVGAITMSGGGGILSGGGGISAAALTKTLRRLKNDDSVKVVVLRIDSPGGSALASDLLWHELMEVRKKKPLVASVGSMAASGGYYMACAANKIVAERTSIVGSIGVVGGKFTFDEALARYGINSVTFPASNDPGAAERAAFISPLTPWDDATREKMRGMMSGTYKLFLKRVADGRGVSVPDVEKVAQGRIWSGVQGHSHKLVDELGGLARALELARELGGLEEDAPVVVEGEADGLMALLGVGSNASAQEVERAVARVQRERPAFLDELAEPVRPFVESSLPLLQGEHTLTAMPFALVIR